ncbi:MAG: cobaltochelatase subunit CobN, partial [Shewanella algae]
MTNNLWGWQVVSPEVVADHQWQQMHEIYVMDSLDLDMKAWFEEHSPEARLRMMERLLDAIRKHYWDAPEQTRRELVEQYQQALAEHSLKSAHEKLADFADTLASGFGPTPLALNSLQAMPAQAFAQQSQNVQGQKLAKAAQAAAGHERQWWWLVLVLLPLLVGATRQYRISRRI